MVRFNEGVIVFAKNILKLFKSKVIGTQDHINRGVEQSVTKEVVVRVVIHGYRGQVEAVKELLENIESWFVVAIHVGISTNVDSMAIITIKEVF